MGWIFQWFLGLEYSREWLLTRKAPWIGHLENSDFEYSNIPSFEKGQTTFVCDVCNGLYVSAFHHPIRPTHKCIYVCICIEYWNIGIFIPKNLMESTHFKYSLIYSIRIHWNIHLSYDFWRWWGTNRLGVRWPPNDWTLMKSDNSTISWTIRNRR